MKRDIFSMEGKNVIFTGGAGHLGRSMVKALLEYGAHVAVPTRNDALMKHMMHIEKTDNCFL